MSDMTNIGAHVQQAPEPTAHQEQAPQQRQPTQEGSSIPVTALRLLLGMALEGKDAAATRLGQWGASVPTSAGGQESPRSDDDLTRYASIGLLMEARTHARKLVRSVVGVSEEVGGRAGALSTFLLNRWPFVVAKPYLDDLRVELDEVLEEWTELGRREERLGRQVARQAMASLIDEVFDAMAKNPEIRELIEQQSVGMAESAVEGVRERTASADALVERLVHNVLRRTPDARSAASSSAPAAGTTTQQNG